MRQFKIPLLQFHVVLYGIKAHLRRRCFYTSTEGLLSQGGLFMYARMSRKTQLILIVGYIVLDFTDIVVWRFDLILCALLLKCFI